MKRFDYRPTREELAAAPCQWNVPADDQVDCRVRGCPRHDPRSSWYWERFAEARQRATGLEVDIRQVGGIWKALVHRDGRLDGDETWSADSETEAAWYGLGLLALSAQGGVLSYWHGPTLANRVFVAPGAEEDDLYVRAYRAARPEPRRARSRLSPLGI